MTERCVRSPFILIHFGILEPKSGTCEAVPDFSFHFSKRTQGTFFWRMLEERDSSLSPERALLLLDCFGDEGGPVPFPRIAFNHLQADKLGKPADHQGWGFYLRFA